ncbi:hypothetical protein BAUCODRAFT_130739 [Baudoinia panamericana UAMH 10762]|uniref:C2H2-type domain-containing protein n=1 Tax=Baudoinia panamericana (strain UAMH 10762) TaxID=717646 RepID=M2NEH2_BAUPA|nr:uncharacterized protein BAUCODRAFT_130739 [Baudoinia panamericana UAMH 10762]EMC97639.1 hypothetical protein BAUCODRAFT_130739 [Baudoinia panamericana UAMH 10762]
MSAPVDQMGRIIRRSPSASPHPPPNAAFTGLTNNHNHIAHDHFNPLNAQGASGAFGDQSFTQEANLKWSLGPTYTEFEQQEQQQLEQSHTADINKHTFLQSAGLSAQDYEHLGHSGPGGDHLLPGLSQSAAHANTSAFPSYDLNQTSFDQSASLDPSLLADLDANFGGSVQNSVENHTGAFDSMATMMPSHSPTPPHLLPETNHRHSQSPSPHASPSFQQLTFQNMNRPRNTSESLDPSSAMYAHVQNEWAPMGAYRHRRIPSDNISELSSHSNQASPYMSTLDSFEPNAHTSPLLDATNDPIFTGDLGFQGISISGDNQLQHQHNYISPGHSPRLPPQQQQQPLPAFTSDDNFGLNTGMNGHFVQQPNGLDLYPGAGHEPFPALPQNPEGAADTMSPPEINIDYAPSNPVENVRPGNAEDTLSPPMRTQSRNRMRAKSDSYAGGARPSTPGFSGRGRSPSLQPQQSNASDLLVPSDNPPSSRSPSPVRGRNGSVGNRARSSSHTSDQRDYILGLAEPERTPSTGADRTRGQRHPATFQCTLCPKKFTRAYNLRSHLRTHTDERPFVCTVCGKAFARQHDRKRHEGLHSGEKKFVCKGNLQSGVQWGCGRRFARADALGRHFRSEAGRVCIKPLLEEEQAERQKAWMDEHAHAQAAAGFVAPQPMLNAPQMDMLFPTALLQQYPALAGIDWNAMPQGPPPEEEYSGRSSFDASSGGEYYDDMSENEMGGVSGRGGYADPGMGGMGMNPMSGMGMGQTMGMGQAQAGGHFQYGVQGGNQAGDYLSDFEGR